MCGRYSLSRSGKLILTNRFGVFEEFDERNFPPFFNLAPTELAPVVFQQDDRHLELMIFGLIPHWAKDASIAPRCINARAETLVEKPAFRDSFKRRRCLVIADGFYEWKQEGKEKFPLRIVMKNREPFAFAGLWDRWKRADGKEIGSFSIITTAANSLLITLHDRMPVILHQPDEKLWLDPSVTDPTAILPLLKPYESGEMEMYSVSRYVNKSTNKGAECIAAV